jgi:hypothetical protein
MQINNNNQKGNMTRVRKITLNAEKRKVIADTINNLFDNEDTQ